MLTHTNINWFHHVNNTRSYKLLAVCFGFISCCVVIISCCFGVIKCASEFSVFASGLYLFASESCHVVVITFCVGRMASCFGVITFCLGVTTFRVVVMTCWFGIIGVRILCDQSSMWPVQDQCLPECKHMMRKTNREQSRSSWTVEGVHEHAITFMNIREHTWT